MSSELLKRAANLKEKAHSLHAQALQFEQDWLKLKGWEITQEGGYSFYKKDEFLTPEVYIAINHEKHLGASSRLERLAKIGDGVGLGE